MHEYSPTLIGQRTFLTEEKVKGKTIHIERSAYGGMPTGRHFKEVGKVTRNGNGEFKPSIKLTPLNIVQINTRTGEQIIYEIVMPRKIKRVHKALFKLHEKIYDKKFALGIGQLKDKNGNPLLCIVVQKGKRIKKDSYPEQVNNIKVVIKRADKAKLKELR